MKTLQLSELQKFSLEILVDVADFCKNNNIRYSLAYGTLLGAVRHKGFIPWDDDIDIIMPREDYLKFRNLYNSNKFNFIDSSKIDDCFIAFGRVCDMKRTITHSYIPWHGKSIQTGVWIDIFPIDSVPDEIDDFKRYYETLTLLQKHTSKLRKIHAGESDRFSLIRQIWAATMKSLNPRFAIQRPEDIVGYINEIISLGNAKWATSSHVSQVTCATNIREWFEAAYFQKYTSLEFEGKKFMVLSEYNKILSIMYGDYMKLPPKNKRKPLQGYIKFFWK